MGHQADRKRRAGAEEVKNFVFSVIVFVCALTVATGFAEVVLRIKNSSMKNYDVEMWRYSKELKHPSPDPVLGHEHNKNEAAVLQSVTIRTNDWGMRGGPVAPRNPDVRRILVLGASITLGWGVKEEETMTSRLQQMFEADGQKVEVLNAGIGNYNAERYVELFFKHLAPLEPTDIVVHYFLRDAEKLEDGEGNFALRNSELALTMWIAGTRLLNKAGEQSLVDHYKQVYAPAAPGWLAAQDSLKRLSDYARAHNIRIFLAMTPDVHDLKDYQFGWIHETMKKVAAEDGYRFVDLLPAFGSLPPEQVWAMPGDPHPNALGHDLMAKALYPVLRDVPAKP
jgi:lysophospholipase L1-like esterase